VGSAPLMAGKCGSEASWRSKSSVARSEAVLDLVRQLAQLPEFGEREIGGRSRRERVEDYRVEDHHRRRSPASTSASSNRSCCGKKRDLMNFTSAGTGTARNCDLGSLPEASVVVGGTNRWVAPTHDLLGHRSPSVCTSAASSVTYATTVRDFLGDEGRGRSGKAHGAHISGPHPRGSASVERRRHMIDSWDSGGSRNSRGIADDQRSSSSPAGSRRRVPGSRRLVA